MDVIRSHPGRDLLDHLEGVRKRSLRKFDRISKFLNWEEVFGFNERDIKITLEVAAKFHDIGKATWTFQKRLRGERAGADPHAPISSLVVAEKLYDLNLPDFLVYCGYAIVRFHHGRLQTPLEEELIVENIEKVKNKAIKDFWKRVDVDIEKFDIEKAADIVTDVSLQASDYGIKGYFLLKLLFSLLTSSDREDAVLINGVPKIQEISYEEIKNFLSKIKPKTWLDNLRKEFQKEVDAFKGDGILSINAPTGIGKTLANILLAAKTIKDKSAAIVYSLPFINIIEQTAEVFRKVFGEDKILEYHHLSDYNIEISEEYSEEDLKKLREQNIQHQLWLSPVIVTTFVSLLESIIGGKKAPFLHRMIGGTLVLDEIQSINHEKWDVVKESIEFLSKMGTTVIISTATKPIIFQGKDVIKNPKKYYLKLNRYKLKIEEPMDIEEFKPWFKKVIEDGKSTLLVLNTIKHAEQMMEFLGKNGEICYLSSRVLPIHRKERIKGIKSGRYKICISTQVIEAGVDVSFERVIREISPIDSIIQAAGRCNRHFEGSIGEVITVPITSNGSLTASKIYGSFLIDKTTESIKILENKKLSEKEIMEFVIDYYSKVVKHGDTDKQNFLESIEKLDFLKLDRFRLIDKHMSASFLILIDNGSEKVFENAIRVSEKYQTGIDKSLLIKEHLAKLSPYIVTTPVYQNDIEFLGGFEQKFGLVIIRGENVKNWYDPVTGLKLASAGGLIF